MVNVMGENPIRRRDTPEGAHDISLAAVLLELATNESLEFFFKA